MLVKSVPPTSALPIAGFYLFCPMFDLRYALEKCVRRETGSLLFLLCVGKVRSVFEVLFQTRLLRRRFMF